MKRVVIDLNIILDMLKQREDHAAAFVIIDACIQKKIVGYICSHEITTLAYFLGKDPLKQKKHTILQTFLDHFLILPADHNILSRALYSSISDYEDAVIDESANQVHVDYIITRNLRDFKKGKTPCITAAEAVAMLI